jgi:hypothetical protein
MGFENSPFKLTQEHLKDSDSLPELPHELLHILQSGAVAVHKRGI